MQPKVKKLVALNRYFLTVIIETASAHIRLLEEVIVEVKIKRDLHMDTRQAEENDAVVRRLNPSGKLPLLLQIQGIFTVSPEVLEKGAAEYSLYSAMAILIEKSSPGLIGHFYIKFNKPLKPTKMFTDRAEAILWLKEQYTLARGIDG